MVTTRFRWIGNLKGDKGDRGDKGDTGVLAWLTANSVAAGAPAAARMKTDSRGTGADLDIPRGLPGLNAVPSDEAFATYLAAIDTQTRAALLDVIGRRFQPLVGPRVIYGTIPNALGWSQSLCPVVPSMKVGADGSLRGSIGLDARGVFGRFSQALVQSQYEFWVSGSGDDTTGDGSKGNPFRSIVKAIGTINGGSNNNSGNRIILDCTGTDGEWAWHSEFSQVRGTSTGLQKVAAFIAYGGRPMVGPWLRLASNVPVTDTTWTNTQSLTYTKTTEPPIRVLDKQQVNANGTWTDLDRVATPALCNTTDNSWCYEPGEQKLYINRVGLQAVRDDNTVVLLHQRGLQFGAPAPHVYFEGIDFIGGRGAGGTILTRSPDGVQRAVVANNCRFMYPGGVPYGSGTSNEDANCVTVAQLNGLVAFFDCEVVGGMKDGVNIHASGGTFNTYLLTVNCRGFDMGRGAGNSMNCWTIHENVVGIDIAGEYSGAKGGTIRNVNQSLMYALGTRVSDDWGDGDLPPSVWAVGDTAQMWLERVYAGGDPDTMLAYNALNSGEIHLREPVPSLLATAGAVDSW